MMATVYPYLDLGKFRKNRKINVKTAECVINTLTQKQAFLSSSDDVDKILKKVNFMIDNDKPILSLSDVYRSFFVFVAREAHIVKQKAVENLNLEKLKLWQNGEGVSENEEIDTLDEQGPEFDEDQLVQIDDEQIQLLSVSFKEGFEPVHEEALVKTGMVVDTSKGDDMEDEEDETEEDDDIKGKNDKHEMDDNQDQKSKKDALKLKELEDKGEEVVIARDECGNTTSYIIWDDEDIGNIKVSGMDSVQLDILSELWEARRNIVAAFVPFTIPVIFFDALKELMIAHLVKLDAVKQWDPAWQVKAVVAAIWGHMGMHWRDPLEIINNAKVAALSAIKKKQKKYRDRLAAQGKSQQQQQQQQQQQRQFEQQQRLENKNTKASMLSSSNTTNSNSNFIKNSHSHSHSNSNRNSNVNKNSHGAGGKESRSGLRIPKRRLPSLDENLRERQVKEQKQDCGDDDWNKYYEICDDADADEDRIKLMKLSTRLQNVEAAVQLTKFADLNDRQRTLYGDIAIDINSKKELVTVLLSSQEVIKPNGSVGDFVSEFLSLDNKAMAGELNTLTVDSNGSITMQKMSVVNKRWLATLTSWLFAEASHQAQFWLRVLVAASKVWGDSMQKEAAIVKNRYSSKIFFEIIAKKLAELQCVLKQQSLEELLGKKVSMETVSIFQIFMSKTAKEIMDIQEYILLVIRTFQPTTDQLVAYFTRVNTEFMNGDQSFLRNMKSELALSLLKAPGKNAMKYNFSLAFGVEWKEESFQSNAHFQSNPRFQSNQGSNAHVSDFRRGPFKERNKFMKTRGSTLLDDAKKFVKEKGVDLDNSICLFYNFKGCKKTEGCARKHICMRCKGGHYLRRCDDEKVKQETTQTIASNNES